MTYRIDQLLGPKETDYRGLSEEQAEEARHLEEKTQRIYASVARFQSDLTDPLQILQEADQKQEVEVSERIVNELFKQACYRGDMPRIQALMTRPELSSLCLSAGFILACQMGHRSVVELTFENASPSAVKLGYLHALKAARDLPEDPSDYIAIISLLARDHRMLQPIPQVIPEAVLASPLLKKQHIFTALIIMAAVAFIRKKGNFFQKLLIAGKVISQIASKTRFILPA